MKFTEERVDQLDAALYRALHMTSGASGRWARLRGLSDLPDENVLTWVSYEWGPSGSFGGPGVVSAFYCGGSKPRLWLDSTPPARPTLEGAALVDAVRRVLNLPRSTNDAKQMELFS